MIYIHAPNYTMAAICAKRMKLPNSQWVYVEIVEQWYGCRGLSIVMVDCPRYSMNTVERKEFEKLSKLILAYENDVVEWVL